ncbi:MAG: aldehyde dehydrogenase family protein [Parcubacteria group bacterium]|nr:aldehyde dehydrogenase family protein [Parcubacteria group bacterium]
MSTDTFRNIAHVDWRNLENRRKMEKALHSVQASMGNFCSPIIDGKATPLTNTRIVSHDPASFKVVCETCESGEMLVQKAGQTAQRAFESRALHNVEKRVALLRRVAEIVCERTFEIAALIVYEVSKPWNEALAEVEEAIDFLYFYAIAAESTFSKPHENQKWIKAERNTTCFTPRGVTAAISAWNFPFALSVEKMAASIASGCPVLFKPAEQSPAVGYEAVKCFLDASIPEGYIAFLPGTRETGECLVKSNIVTQITFTGSKQAGIHIHTAAAQTPGILGPKRVDLEMGGNNPMIVCASAIHDEAIRDWVSSKFGFMGQKCSALQRGIIVGDQNEKWVKDFCSRLQHAAHSVEVGHPEDPRYTYGGALIDKDAYQRVMDVVSSLSVQDKIASETTHETRKGFFVMPRIFTNAPPKIVSSEIFGPILFLSFSPTLPDAVQKANATEFALTAGIHTELNSEIEYFRNHIRAGNVYINRSITGALVGRQPFGGYKYSGFGEKVGSPERILFFSNAQSVSENLLRHGTIA